MTLEERARLIADYSTDQPRWALEDFALRMLREAVEQAAQKNEWPTHKEWV